MLPAGLLFRCAYVYPKMYPNTAELPVAVGLFPSRCDTRLIQYYTRNQQDEFIKQLPQSEKGKIEKQITLYKQAREFYRESL